MPAQQGLEMSTGLQGQARPIWISRFARGVFLAGVIGWSCILACMLAREASLINTQTESWGCFIASMAVLPLVYLAWNAFDSIVIRSVAIVACCCMALLGTSAVVGNFPTLSDLPLIGGNSRWRTWFNMSLIAIATCTGCYLWYFSLHAIEKSKQFASQAFQSKSEIDTKTFSQSRLADSVESVDDNLNMERRDRQKLEEALHRVEQQLQLVLSSAPIVLTSIDKDHVVERFEGQALCSVGLETGQFNGSDYFELWEEEKELSEAVRRALKGESPDPVTHTVGHTRMETFSAGLTDTSGDLNGAVAVCVDVTDREKAESILRTISHGTSRHVGTDFFESLVRHVAEALEVSCCFVAECVDHSSTQLRTLAFWNKTGLIPDFEYEFHDNNNKETDTSDEQLIFNSENIKKLFPEDFAPDDVSHDNYYAISLKDSSGQVIGHLAILNEQKIRPDISDLPAVQIFAERAAVELERNRTEEAMKDNFELLTAITDGTSDAVFVKDAAGRYMTMNRACANLLDGSRKELLGLKDADLFEEAIAEQLVEDDNRVRQSGQTTTYEEVLRIRDQELTFLTTKGPYRDARGNTIGVFGIARDVSEQKLLESALRKSEEFHRLLFDKHIDGVAVFSNHRIKYANPVMSEITGYSNAELLKMRTGELTIKEDSERLESRGKDLYGGASEYPAEYRFRKKDGGIAYVEFRSRKLDVKGQPTIISFIRDVTEDKKAERALRLTQFAVDKASAAIFWIRRDQTFLYVNDAACNSLGYPRSQLMGKNFQDVNPEYPLEQWDKFWKQVQHSRSLTVESRHVKNDGTQFPVETTFNFLKFENHQYMCVFVNDISVRKRAELAERKSHSLLRTIIEGTTDVVYLQNLENKYLLINPAGASVLERDEVNIIGRSDVELFGPEEGAKLEKENEMVVSTQKPVIRETVVNINGREHVFQTNKAPYLDADGSIVGVMAVCRDVTELKRSADKSRQLLADLAHVSRLYTMGEMASGIAHEINQPLAAIGNYTSTIDGLITDSNVISKNRLRGLLNRIEKQSYRAGEIIRHLRGLVKRSDPVRTVVDVRELVNEVVSLTSREIKLAKINLVVRLPSTVVEVEADSIQIQQVIVNLVRNAIDALLDVDSQSRELEIDLFRKNDKVELIVTDTGPGFSSEKSNDIFTAFFTTKPDGMGMGLAISRSIIESHRGRMWYSTSSAGRTRFHFTLPAAMDN